MKGLVALNLLGIGHPFAKVFTTNATAGMTIDRDHSCRLGAVMDAIRNFPYPNTADVSETFSYVDLGWPQTGGILTDNPQQVEVIKHHYQDESSLSRESDVDELMKDYCDDAVIHEVIDDIASTLSGRKGVQKLTNDFLTLLHAGDAELENYRPKLTLQLIKVHQNHAQVIWKAETPQQKQIFGTDAFTFDKSNRIQSHSLVSLSEERDL